MAKKDMKQQAQEFMVLHNLKKCYECDGVIFKHDHNAEARSTISKQPVIVHEINAGPKTDKTVSE